MSSTSSASIEAIQPFRGGAKSYRAGSIHNVDVHYEEPNIIMRSNMLWDVMSNGVHAGGCARASSVINTRVPLDYSSDAPELQFSAWLEQEGLPKHETVGFMTAAKLTHASFCEWSEEDFKLLVMATAGTSNAARAGCDRLTYAGYHAGTINLFIWTDGRMSQAAMVNAMMTATEAKCAALADLHIIDKESASIATGTTTDAICLAVSQSNSYLNEHVYAGTATTLGCQLAKLVYQAIYKAVSTQQQQ